MANKLIIAFVVALVFQIVTSLEAISPATREKLQEAISDAVNAKSEGAKAIEDATSEIAINIAPAVLPIEASLNVLGKSIEERVKQAKEEHVDITDCTEEVRASAHIEKFDKDAVWNCKRTPKVVKAYNKLIRIEKEVRILLNLEQACSTHANQDKCVVDGIAASSKIVADLLKQLIPIMKNAKPEEANVCIKTTAAMLEYDVAKMIENWADCLQKHFKSL